MQWLFCLIEMFDELFQSAIVLVNDRFINAFVDQMDFNAMIQVGKFTQPCSENVEIECDVWKHCFVWQEFYASACVCGSAALFDTHDRNALLEFLVVGF